MYQIENRENDIIPTPQIAYMIAPPPAPPFTGIVFVLLSFPMVRYSYFGLPAEYIARFYVSVAHCQPSFIQAFRQIVKNAPNGAFSLIFDTFNRRYHSPESRDMPPRHPMPPVIRPQHFHPAAGATGGPRLSGDRRRLLPEPITGMPNQRACHQRIQNLPALFS